MGDIAKLLELQWPTLLLLASGYAAYCVANVGVREHHKATDVAFSTLLFAFISASSYYACLWYFELSLVWSSAATFLFAILAGAFWSLFGRRYFEKLLRKSRVSHADDLPSAWMAIFGQKIPMTQLSVQIKDGSWLMCDDLAKFANSPNGPCVLGAKGDILMYVTDKQSDIGVAFFPTADPVDPDWGHEITYIPADQIIRVDLRRKP
jgi:hypothetical protein